ncbi:MAG: PhnD/SsuA/transferrin family substrate-binding protein [Sulfitobacter sp.]
MGQNDKGSPTVIASLMMYARPELAGAHNQYWINIRKGLKACGIDAPKTLANAAPEFDVWEAPDLVFSQTCGMPYRTRLVDQVTLVGTPDFGVDGCAPGYYRSALVVRADDPRTSLLSFREARFVYNMNNSQSGFAAPYALAQSQGFWFKDRIQSGAHILSARAVAQGQADIAALDAVTWRLMQKYDPAARDLKVLTWTEPTPGLPYITGKNVDGLAVFDAVADAISTLSHQDRQTLGLRGLVKVPKALYLAIANPPAEAS